MLRLLFLLLLAMTAAQAAGPPALTIHYFRADGCPHCEDAGAFFARLAAEEPRLIVRDYEVSRNPENRALFQAALQALGVEEGGVPFIFVGDWATLGYHADATTGTEIRQDLGPIRALHAFGEVEHADAGQRSGWSGGWGRLRRHGAQYARGPRDRQSPRGRPAPREPERGERAQMRCARSIGPG